MSVCVFDTCDVCDVQESEDDVKRKSKEESTEGSGAKTLCIPFEQPPLPEGTKCFITGKPAKSWTLFGRSY
jgi:prolyl-tRNA synthetase